MATPTSLAQSTPSSAPRCLTTRLVRVKIWDADGQIIYSDAAELIGETYPLGEDEQDALRTGRIEAEVSDLAEPENRLERAEEKLLEVYLPVGGTGSDALLFEAYYRYDVVAASGSQLWRSFAPISLGGLVVLALIQLPLAWSLARRLRDRLREREALTWRALEASEGERRQIASDLHDGVVQELTGIAYVLSATARQPTVAAADLEPMATSVRDRVRSLRSLVVDLTPAQRRGTRTALGVGRTGTSDVERQPRRDRRVGPARRRSVTGAARILYRVALEGLRNVSRHARQPLRSCASHTLVDTRLEVTDNGRGFDPSTLSARAAEGHLGLRALRGVVTDAGGSLETISARRARNHVAGRGAGPMIRVLITDDHAVVRSGLERLLSTADDITVVGSANNGREAISAVEELTPDVVMMDLSMPEMDGVAATREITTHHPDIAVVVLTSFSDTARITAALQAGAIGYQLKDADPDDLIAAVRAAAAGGAPLDPRAARVLLDRRQPSNRAQHPRDRGPPTRHRRPRQQADRPTARHRRTYRQGPSDQHLQPHRRHRPNPGRTMGETTPRTAVTSDRLGGWAGTTTNVHSRT